MFHNLPNHIRSLIRYGSVLACLVFLAGCATTTNPSTASPTVVVQQVKGSVNAQAGFATYADSGLGIVQVKDWLNEAKLKVALEKAISDASAFTSVEQGNADFVLDVWVEKVESKLSIFGEGFIIEISSIWRLTQVKDGKVLACDFVVGHGASRAVATTGHRNAMGAATRDLCQKGLLVVCDQPGSHMRAMPVAGVRPSMGPALPEGVQLPK